MPVDLAFLFALPRSIDALRSFVGLANKLETGITRLCSEPYNSAIRCLSEAQTADDPSPLVISAQTEFRRALTLESGCRLASSFLGLAFCQSYLGEISNAILTLQELGSQNFGSSTRMILYSQARALKWFLAIWGGIGLSGLALVNGKMYRLNRDGLKAYSDDYDRLTRRLTGLTDEDAAKEIQLMAVELVNKAQ